jgi:hypothetical protein
MRSGKAKTVGEQIKVFSSIDETIQRYNGIARAPENGKTVTVGMGAGQRHKIVFAQQAVGLSCDALDHIGKSDAVVQLRGEIMPARVRGGLEIYARNPRSLKSKPNERSQLIFVHASLKRQRQGHMQISLS